MLFIAHMVPKSLQVDQAVRIGEKLTVIAATDRPEPAVQS